jgi:FkbM family methyltransferase
MTLDDFRNWFRQQPQKYFHDFLNDRFYDEIIFKKKDKGFYVEIGALDGWRQSQSIHFEHIKNWDGIIVEPIPSYYNDILKYRGCNVCQQPISDKREINKFVIRDFLAYSHMIDIDEVYGPEETTNIIEVNTITLFDLLELYNSPSEIDFVAIDTEGYEFRILNKFFEENEKYKINLISFETIKDNQMHELMTSNSYLKIRNPYLDFIKMDNFGIGSVRLGNDNNFYNLANVMFDGTINDLIGITWEHYYIHADYLEANQHLIEYLVNYDISNS